MCDVGPFFKVARMSSHPGARLPSVDVWSLGRFKHCGSS